MVSKRYSKRAQMSMWSNLPREKRVSATLEHEDATLSIMQMNSHKHDLEFSMSTPDSDVEFAIVLDKEELGALFYWLSMHMTNCNRIKAGMGPLPIWNGELSSPNKGETNLAVRNLGHGREV